MVTQVTTRKAGASLLGKVRAKVAKGDWDKVEALCDEILAKGEDAEAAYVKALASVVRGDLGTALRHGTMAAELLPDSKEAADLLSVVWALGGEVANASYYRKMAMALPARPEMAAVVPPELPSFEAAFLGARERPLFERGRAALLQGRWREAERYLTQQLAFTPNDRDSHLGLAAALAEQHLWRNAIDILMSCRHASPDDPFVTSYLGGTLTQYGMFAEGKSLRLEACEMAPQSAAFPAEALMDRVRDADEDPGAVARAFAEWGASQSAAVMAVPAAEPGDGVLTVVCYVGGIGATPSASALSDILRRMDPRRFEFIGLGFGELADPVNEAFQAPFVSWVNITGMDVLTLRHVIRAQGPHILVDFVGFHSAEAQPAFAARLAPVQLAWGIHPFDPGLAGFTGVVSDRCIDAEPLARWRVPALAMGDCAALVNVPGIRFPVNPGSGDGRLTFGIDAAWWELHPRVVAVWARILHALPDAALVIRDRNYSDPDNGRRLAETFGFHGLSHRVEVVSGSDVFGFLDQIDILLTSWPVPAASRLVEALWAGVVPVIMDVPNRIGRQGLAILDALGLAERCVGASGKDYVAKAVAWAGDADGRVALAGRVRDDLSRLLDPASRAAALRDMLEDAWRQSLVAGE